MLDVEEAVDSSLTDDDVVAHLCELILVLGESTHKELRKVFDLHAHPNVSFDMLGPSRVTLSVSKDFID